jgi:DNA-binding NarL/FixJ family response regulator
MKIKILLADDHAILRDGIRTALELEESFEIVGEATDGSEAIEGATRLLPDVILMDISMPSVDGIEASKAIKRMNPQIKIILLTMYDNRQFIEEALLAGIEGYILKMTRLDDVIKAIKAVYDGDNYFDPAVTSLLKADKPEEIKESKFAILTEREREILQLIINGCTSNEISERLFISRFTVNNHRKSILLKLGLKNTAELIRYAITD